MGMFPIFSIHTQVELTGDGLTCFYYPRVFFFLLPLDLTLAVPTNSRVAHLHYIFNVAEVAPRKP